jgi:signal transduction histidine kinase
MMKKLETHKDALESEVAIRTLAHKQASDAALSAARHKAEFMAAMTHEMRTPLHSINGYAELVLESLNTTGKNNDTFEWLTIILDSANQLLLRINQILELTRIEANKIELHFESIDLKELINEVKTKIQPLVKANNNQFKIEFSGEKCIRAERDKLLQILVNLLTNACKFTESGSIVLIIECNTQELCIQVSDTGIGIPSEQQRLIFEPFRQLDMSDTRKYPGTGLGLAITKHICNMLSGSLEVISEVGVGSSFIVRIPLPMAPNQGTQIAEVGNAGKPISDLNKDNERRDRIPLPLKYENSHQQLKR